MIAFFRKHCNILTNIVLVICLGYYSFDQALRQIMADQFDFVEVAFATHNVIMLSFILIRKKHQALDSNPFHQAVALVAFFSGIFFREAAILSPLLLVLSQGVTFAAIILGILAFFHLGRSFGIMIAIREVKTGGLYAIIRHPMYFTDILWRVGIILKNPCAINFALFVVSSACYVYRALLEEKFLSRHPEYSEYMQKVRFRFIPGFF